MSADSTPDTFHVNQQTFIFRYVTKRVLKERFVKFIPNCGYKSEESFQCFD